MNPTAIILLIASFGTIIASVPLIRGKVKMNHWYGIRFPNSFNSEDAWFNINRVGGRLLFIWGLIIGITAAVGLLVSEEHWEFFNWVALAIVLAGLLLTLIRVSIYARTMSKR